MRRYLGVGLVGACVAALSLPAEQKTGARGQGLPGPVRVGVVSSLFRGTPRSMIPVLSRPLMSLLQGQTGMAGQVHVSKDACHLGGALQDGKVHLGVFHGFEFAWARQKYPNLKALVLAVNQQRLLRVNLVVSQKCKAEGCQDLKGKTVALPAMSRAHCHLFLERRCPGGDTPPREFFSRITAPTDSETALDDVIDGDTDAAVVDQISLDAFRKSKPKRSARLRILVQSEPFPAAVVAYHPGSMGDGNLARLRRGMLSANTTARGRDLLGMCRMTGFEAVPTDFEQTLTAITKAYPPQEK